MKWLACLRAPYNPARVKALKKRWAQMPESTQHPGQALGRYVVGCGATYGVHERCNFGCTACYLGEEANQQPPMAFEQVAQQLKDLRDWLGPGGNVQITSGEVTLLPMEKLARILREARDLELSPMVMSHGDVFLHHPHYLNHLILEGGLRKVSIHVDLTQRGRKNMGRPVSEAALNPIRDAMAGRLRQSREETGVKVKAAMTLTVNPENLPGLKDVTSWFVKNLDAFRILSFQPQAQTGRTREKGVDADQVWSALEEAFGRSINPHAFTFGHTSCNRIALFLAMETGREPIILEAVEKNHPADQRLIHQFTEDFSGVVFSDRNKSEIAASILGVLLRKPWWLLRTVAYVATRSWREKHHIPRVLSAMLRLKLKLRPFALVVHAFMSRDQLETPEGRERLAACAFKVPINGEMTSMCRVNATDIRTDTYVKALQKLRN